MKTAVLIILVMLVLAVPVPLLASAGPDEENVCGMQLWLIWWYLALPRQDSLSGVGLVSKRNANDIRFTSRPRFHLNLSLRKDERERKSIVHRL